VSIEPGTSATTKSIDKLLAFVVILSVVSDESVGAGVAKTLSPIREGGNAAKPTSGAGPHEYCISTSARTFPSFPRNFDNIHDSLSLHPETIDYLTH
jgi:hypothetical protein